MRGHTTQWYVEGAKCTREGERGGEKEAGEARVTWRARGVDHIARQQNAKLLLARKPPRLSGAALATLAYFTHVFLLDGDIQRGVQHNLTGRDDVHIRKPQSNNPYSGANARDKRLPAPPDVAHYNATFARENCLDAALVAEVRRRVARAGTCAGCAPAPPSSAPKDVCGPRRAWVQ